VVLYCEERQEERLEMRRKGGKEGKEERRERRKGGKEGKEEKGEVEL
jgi:hypothetical protein